MVQQTQWLPTTDWFQEQAWSDSQNELHSYQGGCVAADLVDMCESLHITADQLHDWSDKLPQLLAEPLCT
jgi:hypothetical protein